MVCFVFCVGEVITSHQFTLEVTDMTQMFWVISVRSNCEMRTSSVYNCVNSIVSGQSILGNTEIKVKYSARNNVIGCLIDTDETTIEFECLSFEAGETNAIPAYRASLS